MQNYSNRIHSRAERGEEKALLPTFIILCVHTKDALGKKNQKFETILGIP